MLRKTARVPNPVSRAIKIVLDARKIEPRCSDESTRRRL